jgi:hypothetical protein
MGLSDGRCGQWAAGCLLESPDQTDCQVTLTHVHLCCPHVEAPQQHQYSACAVRGVNIAQGCFYVCFLLLRQCNTSSTVLLLSGVETLHRGPAHALLLGQRPMGRAVFFNRSAGHCCVLLYVPTCIPVGNWQLCDMWCYLTRVLHLLTSVTSCSTFITTPLSRCCHHPDFDTWHRACCG